MARGDFFSGSERRDDRIAGNVSFPSKIPSGPYYGGEEQKKKDSIKDLMKSKLMVVDLPKKDSNVIRLKNICLTISQL